MIFSLTNYISDSKINFLDTIYTNNKYKTMRLLRSMHEKTYPCKTHLTHTYYAAALFYVYHVRDTIESEMSKIKISHPSCVDAAVLVF